MFISLFFYRPLLQIKKNAMYIRSLKKIIFVVSVFAIVLNFLDIIAEAKPPSPDLHPTLLLHPVVVDTGKRCELLLKTWLPLEQYSSFLLTNPVRLVVDIKHADFDGELEKLLKKCSWPGAIRVGRHQEKIRFVFHAGDKADIRYQVVLDKEGLKISLEKTTCSMTIKNATAYEQQETDILQGTCPLSTDDIRQLLEQELPDIKIEMSFFKSSVSDFFAWVTTMSGKGIDVDPDVNATLTMNLQNTSLQEGVLAILTIYKLKMGKRGDRLYVQVP